MVNEKLRKRSVSGKVLAKGFDDMKSEEQTIKPSENIFEKPKQTKELREEDFFGITTYHKDSSNYPTRDIVSDAKEMNHDERKIGQHKDHDQAKIEFNKSDKYIMKKIGDAD